MTRVDIVVGLLLAAGFSAVLWEASTFQYGTEFAPGPGFAPVWLAVLGIVLSLLIAVGGLRAMRQVASGEDTTLEPLDRAGLGRVAAALAGMVTVVLLVPWLGLVLSLLAFLLFLTLVVQRLSFPVGIATSVATAVFIYLMFVRFLGVPIPVGPLGF